MEGTEQTAGEKKKRRRRKPAAVSPEQLIVQLEKSMTAVFPALRDVIFSKRAELARLEALASQIGVDLNSPDPSSMVNVAPPPDARPKANAAKAGKNAGKYERLPRVFTKDDLKKLRLSHMVLPQWARAKLIRKLPSGEYQKIAA